MEHVLHLETCSIFGRHALYLITNSSKYQSPIELTNATSSKVQSPQCNLIITSSSSFIQGFLAIIHIM
jgi:hypothetical protein